MRRGDIYWYQFGRPDKRRPVVVLTRTIMLPRLSAIVVAAISSTRRGATSEVLLNVEDGLPKPCAINLQQVFTLEKASLGAYLTSLARARLEQLDAAIVFALGVGEDFLDS